jgi:septal ring factor EnvC (AmiA/AmiB activator)
MTLKEKLIIYLIGAGVLVLLLNNFLFSGRDLSKAVKKLDEAKVEIGNSIQMLNRSQVKIDSLQADIQRFKSYIVDIQGRVEIIDLEKRVNEAKFATKRDSIRERLKKLYEEIGLVADDLPEIPIENVHSK